MSLWNTRSVAERYAEARPGFRLLACEEAGLPIYWMTLDAVVLDHQPIPVVNEFALRGLEAGFTEPAKLSGFLGLDEPLVDETLSEMYRLDQIDYPIQAGGSRSLRITELGSQTLETLEETQPERREIWFAFDRLLWKPVAHQVSQLMKPRELADADMRELRPRRVARPLPDQLDLVEVSSVLERLTPRKAPSVLAIRHVLRAEQRYLPAHLLIFQSDDSRDTELTVAIDGHLSEAHERALTELGGAEFLRLESEEPSTESVDLAEALVSTGETPESSSIMTIEEVRQLRRTLEPSDEAEPEDATTRDVHAEGAGGVRETIESVPYREIDTYEHAQLFRDARRVTKKRLLVISPWVSGAVVNKAFVRELRELAARKVEISIGYGITRDQAQDDRDQVALERLLELVRQFANVTVARLGDTHAKILIYDSTLVVGSFNWLSFRGDQGRTYRQERGILVRDGSFVDRSYQEHRQRIAAAVK